MSNTRRRGTIALTLALALGAAVTPTALAANVSWSSICAGYAGTSSYVARTGMGSATTTANDNDEVGVAIRYYQGHTAYTKMAGNVSQSRAVVNYGGNHQSYCGLTVTKLSNV